jgi:hypothetical protein
MCGLEAEAAKGGARAELTNWTADEPIGRAWLP